MLKSLFRTLLLGSFFIFSTANASLLVADFEQFDEGFFEDQNGFVIPTFSDGGIDFFGFETFSGTPTAPFIERIGGSFAGVDIPETNTLSVGGGGLGIGFSVTRVSEFSFTFNGLLAQSASIDVFNGFWSTTDAILTIDALFNGNIVGSNSMSFDVDPGPFQVRNLSVAGTPFDTVRLSVFEPGSDGLLATFDNVVVDLIPVPEPSSVILIFGALIGLVVSRRTKKS